MATLATMSKGGLGNGFCGICGGSLFPTEFTDCNGCRPDKEDTLLAKDRLATDEQKAEFKANKGKIIDDLPF